MSWNRNKFEDATPNSLEQYTIMYYHELSDKSRKTENLDESMWYADIAALLLELGCRYDEMRPREPDSYPYASDR